MSDVAPGGVSAGPDVAALSDAELDELLRGFDTADAAAWTPERKAAAAERSRRRQGSAETEAPKRKRGRPKGSTSKAKDTPPKADTPYQRGKLADELTGLVTGIATPIWLMGQASGNEKLAYDGRVILSNAEALGKALDDLAEADPRIRRALTVLTKTGPWTAVVMVGTSIVVPIAANHGLLPPMAATIVGAPMPPVTVAEPGPQPNGPAAGPIHVVTDAPPAH